MVRTITIGLLTSLVLLACSEQLNFDELSSDYIFQQMTVDFTIEILNDETGSVRFIDQSQGVEVLIWDCWIDDEHIAIPNTYPGDTVELLLDEPGTYIVELTGQSSARENMPDGTIEIIQLKKSTVQSLELLNIQPQEFLRPYLNYVTINSFPALDKYGFEWDADGSGPDVTIGHFYTGQSGFVNESLTGNVYDNLTMAQLPIQEIVNFDFSILNTQMSFELIDYDLPRENKYLQERMILESFELTYEDIPLEAGLVEYTVKHFTIGVDWR